MVTHIDKQSCQDQHSSEVHCHWGFKKEWFEEVCGVADHVQEDGGDKDGQEDGQEVPTHVNYNLDLRREQNKF